MARVVIAGVGRNCAATIRGELKILADAFARHSIQRIVLVESDSSDTTPQTLSKWCNEAEVHTAVSLGSLAQAFPLRTERLAYCRNVYLNLFERYDYFGADYLFITDLDGINSHLTSEAIDRALSFLEKMPNAAGTANQLYKYYDIWALRHQVWSPNDCWESYHALRQSLGDVNAQAVCNESRMIHIDPNLPPINVLSAFGGGAFYPTSFLKGCRYEGLKENKEVCEHVAFHARFRENGGQIFILPFLINHDVSEHVANAENFSQSLRSASVVNNG